MADMRHPLGILQPPCRQGQIIFDHLAVVDILDDRHNEFRVACLVVNQRQCAVSPD